MAVPRLRRQHTALLVVDVQEKLLPHIHNGLGVALQSCRLIDGAAVLGLPILATEQYPKGLGPTVSEVAVRLRAAGAWGPQEKLKFSACIEPVREELVRRQAKAVLVCGIEAHVCILQTCLDLLEAGYLTAVAADAIGSRRSADQDLALQRLVTAGVVPTTVESALLEVAHEAGTDLFKRLLAVVK